MWQPIETAPKDGTSIFLYEPGYGPIQARWDGVNWWQALIGGHDVAYDEPCEGRSSEFLVSNTVTHWMPLPEPPAIEESEGEGV